jgi:polyisoprenoid-binding protein YceI
MLRYLFAWVFIAVFSLGCAQNTSSIDFVIRNFGISVDGHFNTFTVNATFNSVGLLENILAEIRVASVNTGIDSRDEHILEKDYFHAEKYELIRLQSETISKKAVNSYEVEAKLSIKGKTKTITIPVTVIKTANNYKITSNFEINRQDFNVGGGSFLMHKTVKINVVQYQKL